MHRTKVWLCTLVLGAGLTGTACAAHGGYRAGYAPPPPPPRMAGPMGVAPGPGFVWIEGYWEWRGRDWSWVGGRWVRPPHPRAVWVPGYWSQHRHGHKWHKGYWRRQ